jgi:hypothetical protein
MTTTTWVALGLLALFLVLYLMRRKSRLDKEND